MKYNSQEIIEQYWSSQSKQLHILEDCILSGMKLNSEMIEKIEKLQRTELEVFGSVLGSQNRMLELYRNCGASVGKENIVFEDQIIKKYNVEISENNDRREIESILDNVKGTVIVAGENDAYSEAVMEFLRNKGIRAARSGKVCTEEQAEKIFADNTDVCGLIISGRSISHDDIVSAFLMCKLFIVSRRETALSPFIVFTSFLGGRLGLYGAQDNASAGSFSGMAKTLAQELKGYTVKLADFEYDISPEKFIYELSDELYYRTVEAGRTGGKRFGITVKKIPTKPAAGKLSLTGEDVIVVSGGAAGVTAECVTELSRCAGCNIVLLGRTEILYENADNAETAKLRTNNELKTYFARLWKEQGRKFSLRDVEKKADAVFKTRTILETMKIIFQNGCKVFYYPCNICDRAQIKEVMKKIASEVGTVTGIIHGAVVIRDSAVEKKTAESFRLVFDTKYTGLTELVECTDKDKLKLLVTFSSIAGLFGNYGQIDYASGNSFMDRYVRSFSEKHPQCRSVSFNWSAWDGGMVNAVYRKALKSRGIVLIPLDTGARYFVSEIMYGDSEQVLISNEINSFSGENK